jgi:hypothetical protein
MSYALKEPRPRPSSECTFPIPKEVLVSSVGNRLVAESLINDRIQEIVDLIEWTLS